MPDPRLLESFTLLVAHVESLEPLNSWQELYPVSNYWKSRFNSLDSLVKRLCELSGITIERAAEAPYHAHFRAPDSSWFEGSTFLEFRRLTKPQIIQAKF